MDVDALPVHAELQVRRLGAVELLPQRLGHGQEVVVLWKEVELVNAVFQSRSSLFTSLQGYYPET